MIVLCATVIALSAVPVAAQPGVPNPPWPARCPLRLGLIVDRSSSMSARFNDVREAASNVVDSLRDKPSEVTIIGFGSSAEVIGPSVNVSDEDSRHQLKDQIGQLTAHDGEDGATNWEAALTAVRQPRLDVVVLLTDGLPNAYGNPVREGPAAVDAAVAAADQLKTHGTRLVAVGIDLGPEGEQNLRVITGSGRGEDYYVTDTAGLLRQLYGIVASSCGVPMEQLPQPEPPEFPWWQTIVGTLSGLLIIGLAALVLHRRRGASGRGLAPAGRSRSAVSGSAIDHSHLTSQLRADHPTPSTTKDSS